jgi:16S rRNA (guanine527-N7)-methyltransferase
VDKVQVQLQIEGGLSALSLTEPTDLAARLCAYLELLLRWNAAYNLTAVRDPADMVTRHLMDSLAVLPFVGQERALDVGTGAGLPGLVLALAHPGQPYVLLDSSGKKTRFVEHAVDRLGIKNVAVIKARAEEHVDDDGFAVVLSRAFSTLADFVRVAGHLARSGGRLLAMKGALPESELEDLPAGWRLQAVHRLTVPGLQERRHLLEISCKDMPT